MAGWVKAEEGWQLMIKQGHIHELEDGWALLSMLRLLAFLILLDRVRARERERVGARERES